MKIQELGRRRPEEIPIAGVTLRECMLEVITSQELENEFSSLDGLDICDGDEVWRFRTPEWTWANMGGRMGVVIIRNGLASHWIVSRMN